MGEKKQMDEKQVGYKKIKKNWVGIEIVLVEQKYSESREKYFTKVVFFTRIKVI